MRDDMADLRSLDDALLLKRVMRRAEEEVDLEFTRRENPDLAEVLAALPKKRGCRR